MSEPVFEASVRLRAETTDFEREAAADLRRATAELEKQAAQVRIPAPQIGTDLEQQLTEARRLASEPLDLEVLANTQPFEREVNQAYDRVLELAERNAAQRKQIEETATAEAAAAQEAFLNAPSRSTEDLRAVRELAAIKDEAVEARREAESLIKVIEGEAGSARVRPAAELQTRAQTEALRAQMATEVGDAGEAGARELEAAILAARGASEASKLNAEQLFAEAATLTGVEAEALRVQAEAALLASRRLESERQRLQAEGLRPAGVPGQEPGRGGFLGGLGEFARASGRTGGLGGILASGARLGAIGFAATAAFQALGELQQGLRVTGDEAFTTEGKLRNLGAELLGGNIIGGIKAITADRPAPIAAGVTQAVQAYKLANDELFVTEEKLIAAYNEGQEALAAYLGELSVSGHISEQAAQDYFKVAESLAVQKEGAEDAAFAIQDYAAALAQAGSEAAAFGERQNELGLRGPGGVTAAGGGQPAGVQPGQVIGFQRTGIPRPILAPDTGGTFQAGTGGEEVAARIRASITSRLKDEEERTRLQLRDAQIVQKQARSAFETAKEIARAQGVANGAAAEWEKYVAATTAVADATVAAKEATERAAAEAAALDDRIRDARAAQIRDPGARAEAELAGARQDEAEALKARDATRSGTRARKEAQAAYEEAVAARVQIEEAIKETGKREAEIAKQEAEQAANNARTAREQALQNDIARAALTKRKSDDIKFYNAAIDYYRTVSRTADTALEREQAQSKIIELRKGLQSVLQGDTGSTEDIELLRLENRAAAARLTQGLGDDKKAADALIAYWKQQVADAEGVEKERARSRLISARLARQALSQQQGESAEVFAQALFQRATDEFKRFGSNISDSPTGILAPQDARGAFAGFLGGDRFGFQRNLMERQVTEQQTTNSILRGISASLRVPRAKEPIAPEIAKVVGEIGTAVLRGM